MLGQNSKKKNKKKNNSQHTSHPDGGIIGPIIGRFSIAREAPPPHCFAQAFTGLLSRQSPWVPIVVAVLLWEPTPHPGDSCGKYPPHPPPAPRRATDLRRGFAACKLVYMADGALRTLVPHKNPTARVYPFHIARHVHRGRVIASVNFAELIRRLGASLIHVNYRRFPGLRGHSPTIQ